jgi:hypothetical protein
MKKIKTTKHAPGSPPDRTNSFKGGCFDSSVDPENEDCCTACEIELLNTPQRFRFRVVVQVQQLEPSQDLFYSRLDLVQNEIWILLFGFTTNATTAAAGGTSSKVAARVGNGQAALTPSKAITVS